MKSHIVTVLLVGFYIATTNGKQLPGDTDAKQDYIPSGVYNQSESHVMQYNQQPDYYGYGRPCPNAEGIIPCVCTYDSKDHAMDLDCSDVQSEEQLKQIFDLDFPFKKFREFYMVGNEYLTVLESHVFGDVSFESMRVIYNNLGVTEIQAFDSCYETASELDFSNNKLTHFTFHELYRFSKLKSFSIADNLFSVIPADAFNGLLTLEYLELTYFRSPKFVGRFENLPNLKKIYLWYNEITTVPTQFINTGSSNLEYIGLGPNNIVSVEPGAFNIGEELLIDMGSNSLSTLEEATWRPLLETGGWLQADYNPLVCGCDIAWLFDDDYLLSQVNEKTTCSDGGNIHDLDPSIFDLC